MKTLVSLSLIAISVIASAQQYTPQDFSSYTNVNAQTVTGGTDLPLGGKTITFDGIPFTFNTLAGATTPSTGAIQVFQQPYPGKFIPAGPPATNTVYLLMSGDLANTFVSLDGPSKDGFGHISAFNVAGDNIVDSAYFQNGNLSGAPTGTKLDLVKLAFSASDDYRLDQMEFENISKTSPGTVYAITTSTPEPNPILAGLFGISAFGFIARRRRTQRIAHPPR